MPAPTLAQRERILKRYGKTYFACPTNLDYPLDARARNCSIPDGTRAVKWDKITVYKKTTGKIWRE